jgi:hypothetical protein
MSVSLLEVLAAARSHAAPLAAESAGYLLLAVADHLVAAPCVVAPEDVELLPDGNVRVRPVARGAAHAEQTLRRLLGRALEVSSAAGPALRRAAERRDETGLFGLVRELEVALIPVNRGAARRALSRLHRETERARDSGRLATRLVAESAAWVAQPSVGAGPEPAAVPAPRELVPTPAVVPPAPAVAPAAAGVPTPAPAAAPPSAPFAAAPPAWIAAVEPSEPAPPALPAVTLAAPPPLAKPRLAPPVELTLTPPPQQTEGEPALTKPEPVVLRARERGSSTPRLGTVVTVQTLPGEEMERSERAALEAEPSLIDIEVDIEVEGEPPLDSSDELTLLRAVAAEPEPDASEDLTLLRGVVTQPELSEARQATVAAELQALSDPEPSQLPDVLSAMVELHTGLDADEAPTRLREVVTELLAVVQPVPLLTPEPQQVEDAWLTPSSLDEVSTAFAPLAPTPLRSEVAAQPEVEPELEPIDPALHEATTWHPPPLVEARRAEPEPELAPESAPEPEPVEAVVVHRFESELAAPELHEALTWYPAPVVTALSPLPPDLLIAEPLPDPSPCAPAVLPARSSDVSELLDSFYVSGGAEEGELRSALKEMAGLELTPMPEARVEEG